MRSSCRRTGTPSAEAAEAIGGLCLRGRSALSLSLKRRRHDRHGSETSAGLPRARGNACSSCRHCDRPMRAKAKTRAIVRAGPADARRWRVDGRLRSRSARSAHAARSPPGLFDRRWDRRVRAPGVECTIESGPTRTRRDPTQSRGGLPGFRCTAVAGRGYLSRRRRYELGGSSVPARVGSLRSGWGLNPAVAPLVACELSPHHRRLDLCGLLQCPRIAPPGKAVVW
jgi:hypothetical protein